MKANENDNEKYHQWRNNENNINEKRNVENNGNNERNNHIEIM
jgi:hypothetical protein